MPVDDRDLAEPAPRVRLPLMKSPVVDSTDHRDKVEIENPGLRDERTTLRGGFISFKGEHVGLPIFRKFEDASLLELFTDLFFAANYTVFTQTQKVVGKKTLAAYIGYFCTLWITWLLIALYDVRYVTDCVFERLTRAVQLGVLVGFAVVAPKFNPYDQDRTTMRIMSVILAVSRFCLGVEYMVTLWHCRKFRKARLPLGLQSGFCFALGFIYLGITFRFRDEHNSRVFISWYILAAGELAFTLGLSGFWQVLTFVRTHLMKRLSLLTVIILGDGIIVMAQDVVKMTTHKHAWNELTIGLVTSCAVMIYCVFLIYFDWIRENYLTRWRQVSWVVTHLPFHLSLVLFMHGFSQLIIYTKIIDAMRLTRLDSNKLFDFAWVAQQNTTEIFNVVTETWTPFFDDYEPTAYAFITLQTAMANISSLPDTYWKEHPTVFWDTYNATEVPTGPTAIVFYSVASIALSMYNSVFEAYGIKIMEEMITKDKNLDPTELFTTELQADTLNAADSRYGLVFAYGYICSGVTLIMLVVLTVISRKQRWTAWPLARNVFNVLLGIAMASISTIWFAQDEMGDFLTSGWAIPTITLFWLLVLILTHVGNGAFAVKRMTRGEKSVERSEEGRNHSWAAKLGLGGLLRKDNESTYNVLNHKHKRNGSSEHEMSYQGAGGYDSHEGATVTPDSTLRTNGKQGRSNSFYDQIGHDGTGYGRVYDGGARPYGYDYNSTHAQYEQRRSRRNME